MTVGNQVHTGGRVARPGQARVDDIDAGVPVRAERPWLLSELAASENAVDLRNVVPFRRAREAARSGAPEVVLPVEELVAPASSLTRERIRIAAFALVSLAIHVGLFFAFWREPDPLASIGVQVISVEIVVGATAPAGIAETPGENETASPAAPADPEPAEAVRQAEQKATVQPQDVPVAQQDAAPEQSAPPEPKVEEPQQVEATRPEPAAQSEMKPPVTVMESEQPDPKPPEAVAVAEPEPARPAEVKPSEVKPAEVKPLAKPVPPKPVQQKPVPKQEPTPHVARRPVQTKSEQPTRTAAPTQERPSERARASAPASPANNIGRGRSDNDTNYRGLVAAHLARFKQYPSDARNSGKTGTAAVTFSIGGGGGVTSVRLARGSGIASIDQEVVAMVRRASPFPPPPGGRPQSFTVPVSFRLN